MGYSRSDTGPTPSAHRTPPSWWIRAFTPVDLAAPSWVRCRTLSFLTSSYYDDVHATPTRFDGAAIRLVAVRPRPAEVQTPGPDQVVGLIDVELFDAAGEPVLDPALARTATIDSIAVHPDHARRGIASTLLEAALRRLTEAAPQVRTIDAWTREDPAATAWYLANGFTDMPADSYVHVHKSWDDSASGWAGPDGLSAPVLAFAHGALGDLEALRNQYARVYVCHRYLQQL